MRRLLFVFILLILYASLYPWRFNATPLRPLLEPLEFGQFRDFILNVWLYVPLGAVGYWAFSNWGKLRFVAPVLLGFGLSLLVECVQVYVPSRVSAQNDLLANTVGGALGVLIACFLRHTPRAGRFGPRWNVEAFLLLSWLAYLTMPLFPVRGFTARLNLREFLNGSMAWSEFPLWVAAWILVWELIPAVFPRGAERAWILAAGLLLLPARIQIITRTLTKSEVLGALLAVVLLSLSAIGLRLSPRVTAVLLLIAIGIRGLAPFEFTIGARPFAWIPFAGFLEGNWQAATIGIALKLYLYGSAVWAVQRCGLNWAWSGISTALFLLAIEILQRHLPAHFPEITDPLMALACAAGFAAGTSRELTFRNRSTAGREAILRP
jgi:glycopeptide antibiotics resistance protein